MWKSLDLGSAPPPDWDRIYREGTPPWESGVTSEELIRVWNQGLVCPGTMLELGCGTGADAVWLAQQGFDVTAVDASPTAIERARTRAGRAGAAVCFVLADVFDFVPSAGSFDFIYDAGFYHFMREINLDGYLELLWKATHPGTLCLALAGAVGEEAEGGPPAVSEEQIRWELGRLFEFVHLRPFRFESPNRKEGYLGWSCLMRRPMVPV